MKPAKYVVYLLTFVAQKRIIPIMNYPPTTSNTRAPVILPISAFEDNYIWLAYLHGHALVVDPGDVIPVLAALKQHNLTLNYILITHHHADHIGGVETLLEHWPQAKVYAPAKERYTFAHQAVIEADIIKLELLDWQLQVMELPGHTLGHIAYYGHDLVFCGDTLFGAGCGRLFEGTPKQLYDALQRLAALPDHTQVFCTHEYTQRNIAFALQFEPNNAALQTRAKETAKLRANHITTLPSSIGLEKASNPFLRCHSVEIQAHLGLATSNNINDETNLNVFTKLRQMRNHF